MSQPATSMAEEEFIEECCRTYLAQWADRQVQGMPIPADAPQRYLDFARQKKWVSAEGRVLAGGFKVAASYLRR